MTEYRSPFDDDGDEGYAPPGGMVPARLNGIGKPFVSNFGAIRWEDLDKPGVPYEWLIDDLIPARERVLIYGDPQCGKSYLGLDMALCVARGLPFYGREVQRTGVIYCAFEGGKGFQNRVNAYRKHHGLHIDDGVPFMILTREADLFASEEDMTSLQAEIEHWSHIFETDYGISIGLIVFDTISACTPGMDENLGKEFGKFLGNAKRIVGKSKCTILLIHHKPKSGDSPRGSGKLTGDLETTIEILFDPWGNTDDDERRLRIARITKQREGETGKLCEFVLKPIEVGKKPNGKPITACIVVSPGGEKPDKRGTDYRPGAQEGEVFRALLMALEEHGCPPPIDIGLPPEIDRVVTYRQWREKFESIDSSVEQDEEKRRNQVKSAMGRAGKSLVAGDVIGRLNPWVWYIAGREVRGFPQTFKRKVKRVGSDGLSDLDDNGF